jgi:hypothetical protein
MTKSITISVAERVEAAAAAVFAAACDSDLPAIIKPRGALPGVLKVEGHAAPWSAPGQSRLLRLTDGSTLREELSSFARDKSFAYRVSSFTGPFAALVSEGRGEWHFTTTGPKSTQVDWTYGFTPKSAFATPAVWFLVKALWPGYIQAALKQLKAKVEAAA